MWAKIVLAAVLASVSTLACAETAVPRIDCQDRKWRRVFEAEVAALGLTERADTFSSVVYGMQKLPGPYEISVVITDCRMSGRSVRIMRLSSMPSFAGTSFSFVPFFAIYASVGYIRGTEKADLVRDARKLTCLVQAAVAENRDAQAGDIATPVALECMLREAHAAGDAEHAKWLRRRLGLPSVSAEVR